MKISKITLNQLYVIRFYQQLFEAEGETVGMVFFSFNAIKSIKMSFNLSKLRELMKPLKRYQNVLLSLIKVADLSHIF